MSYRRGPAAREMLTGRGWITDLSIRVRHFSGAACTAGGLTLLLLVLVLGRFLSLRRGPGDGAVAELGLDAIDRAVQQLTAFVLRVLEQARVVGAEGEARRLHADQSDRAEAAGSPRVEQRLGRCHSSSVTSVGCSSAAERVTVWNSPSRIFTVTPPALKPCLRRRRATCSTWCSRTARTCSASIKSTPNVRSW